MGEPFSLWAPSSLNAVVVEIENDLRSKMLENKLGDSSQFPAVPHVSYLPLGKSTHFSVLWLLVCKAEIVMHRWPVLFG